MYKAIVGFLLFWCKISGCKLEGLENLPKTGAVVTMANHVHVFDPLLLASAWWGIKRPVRFMGKAEFFEKKFLGKIFRALGAFPVNRGEADIASLKTALGILKEEQVLGIFPEGTRGDGSALLRPQPGTVLLALRSGAPIVPMAIVGADKVLPQGKRFPRPAKVKIFIGEAIRLPTAPKGLPRETMGEYSQLLMDRIDELRSHDTTAA